MSVYNKERSLRVSMQSVFDQTFADFEFVIFDNKSTDHSVDVIKHFTDGRVRFFQNSRNLGPGGSMNNCIEAARGEYLVFFHGDDLWERTFLETNVRFLERFKSINVAHSLMHSTDEDGRKSLSSATKDKDAYEITSHHDVLKRLFKSCYLQTPTVVYRRNAMRYFDFRYTYACDWDMYLHLAAEGNDFLFINEPLMCYGKSPGSETSVGVKGGNLVVESYLLLRNFFATHPEYSGFRRKSCNRLSAATLRRTRAAATREQAYFLMRCAILFNPLQLLNPGFYLYLLLGTLFGPAGLRMMKSTSNSIKGLLRGKG
jgi:glycosyltransferase involved in cell wall biosynthesis